MGKSIKNSLSLKRKTKSESDLLSVSDHTKKKSNKTSQKSYKKILFSSKKLKASSINRGNTTTINDNNDPGERKQSISVMKKIKKSFSTSTKEKDEISSQNINDYISVISSDANESR